MEMKELFDLYKAHPVITTDSRHCPEGSIFVALKGATFDGNQYARQALAQGCSYAIIDDPAVAEAGEKDDRLIVVADALQTYKDLAREHRRQFDIPVVAITGTNGKTTTKELVSAVLAEEYRVMATEGNFNNDVGVPKTLLRLTDKDDIAVVEMGASHPGDIKTLVETAEPTSGIVTNVGRAHLDGFGSMDGVRETKGELYDYLVAKGHPIFANYDDEQLKVMIMMAAVKNAKSLDDVPDVYFYGQSDAPDVLIRGEVVKCDPFLTFRWREQDADTDYKSEWMEVKTQLIGDYNLNNLLAAITVGYVNNISFEKINHALASYVPTNNRSQLVNTEHNCLIVDAYNANPTSMKAALDNFRRIEAPHKMVILGMMGELADVSADEHRKVVARLQKDQIEEVWLVGSEFEKIESPYRTFADVEAVKAELKANRPEGRTILIKGSNANRLFELPELL